MFERKFAMLSGRVAAVVIAVVLSALASTAFAQSLPMRMVLDWQPQGQQSPFIMAVEDGFFARAGVAAKIDGGNGSGDAIVKVASGAYDMGLADLGAVLQFNARQGATKVISVFQVYDVAPMVVMTLKKTNIRTPADLAGKRLAAPPGASSRVMLPLLARAGGFDMATIQWIDVAPQLRPTLFAQGRVDGIPTQITDLATMAKLDIAQSDIAVLRFSDFGVDIYGHAVITTPEFAAAHPDTVRASLKAIAAALVTAIADPAKAIAALKRRDPLIDETVERGRLDLSLANAVVTDRVRKSGLSAVVPERLQRTIAMVSEAFAIPPADPAALYRPDYLPSREDRALRTP